MSARNYAAKIGILGDICKYFGKKIRFMQIICSKNLVMLNHLHIFAALSK